MANLSQFVNNAFMREFMVYLATYNTLTQVIALDGSTTPDIQSTGTNMAFIDGVPEVIEVDAALDISAAATAGGAVIPAGYTQYFIVTAAADGTLDVLEAGPAVASANKELKVPDWKNTSTGVVDTVCVGIMEVANGTASDFTLGTTNLDASNITTTIHQVIGPVFPHPDNLDKN